jgi:hypothetical protein
MKYFHPDSANRMDPTGQVHPPALGLSVARIAGAGIITLSMKLDNGLPGRVRCRFTMYHLRHTHTTLSTLAVPISFIPAQQQVVAGGKYITAQFAIF